MKTKDYVKEFTVQGNKAQYFNNKGFVKAFSQEFNDRLEVTRIARESRGNEFTFNLFQNLVKEMEDKFWAISNKKPGAPFTPGLWNAFYAVGVIPARKKYFPKEHEEIDARRKREAERAKEKGNARIAEIQAIDDRDI